MLYLASNNSIIQNNNVSSSGRYNVTFGKGFIHAEY